jgi:hypothetical protein
LAKRERRELSPVEDRKRIAERLLVLAFRQWLRNARAICRSTNDEDRVRRRFKCL